MPLFMQKPSEKNKFEAKTNCPRLRDCFCQYFGLLFNYFFFNVCAVVFVPFPLEPVSIFSISEGRFLERQNSVFVSLPDLHKTPKLCGHFTVFVFDEEFSLSSHAPFLVFV